jgi:hypothetical protein
VEVYLYSFSTSALGGCGWSAPRPDRFTPGKDPVPIVQEAGWAPGPVWTCATNFAPTGIFLKFFDRHLSVLDAFVPLKSSSYVHGINSE